jgi:hypothetical protein
MDFENPLQSATLYGGLNKSEIPNSNVLNLVWNFGN